MRSSSSSSSSSAKYKVVEQDTDTQTTKKQQQHQRFAVAGSCVSIVLVIITVVALATLLTWALIPQAKAIVAFNNNSTITVIINNGASSPHSGNGKQFPWDVGNISQPDAHVNADVFDMKLAILYVAEDVDPITQNNKGIDSPFYVNPQCDANHLDECGTSPDMAYQITDFFHYAQNSSEINRELNAQQRSIQWFDPSHLKTSITYKFIRMEMCKYGAGPPNVRFQGGNMTEPHEFAVDECGITYPIDPPLVVSSGDNIMVNLTYSLSNIIKVYNQPIPNSTWCKLEPSNNLTYCIDMPQFVPAAYRI